MGAVLVEGVRGCGKTSTGLQHAASSVRLDQSPELLTAAELDPVGLLEGPAPRLVDEWQLAPHLWNVMRRVIDDRQQTGQFILSGSATPADDITRHSGAGRVARVRMRPMALAESGASTGQVRMAELAGGGHLSGESALSLRRLSEQAIVGGWPGLLGQDVDAGQFFVRSYVDNLTSVDLPEAVGVRHDVQALRRVMASVARNLATEVSLARIATDVSADGRNLDVKTVRQYLDALTRVFALEELPAWTPNLRSRSRIRRTAKLHFCDPSLACAVLGIGPDRLLADLEYLGFVFESMVLRDLRVYVEADQARVFHYRDNTGLEIDAIIEWPDGSWAGVEVKLGGRRVAEAERALLRLRDERVDARARGSVRFLAVVTGTSRAYTLPSGVHVIPLGLLGP